MKFYHIILVLLLIAYINTEDGCKSIKNPSKKSDCNGKLSSTEQNKYSHCCYVDNDEGKACVALKKDEFDSLEQNIKEAKDKGEKVGTIECNSSYLKIGLLSLLFAVL